MVVGGVGGEDGTGSSFESVGGMYKRVVDVGNGCGVNDDVRGVSAKYIKIGTKLKYIFEDNNK